MWSICIAIIDQFIDCYSNELLVSTYVGKRTQPNVFMWLCIKLHIENDTGYYNVK